MPELRDYEEWHDAYADPNSSQAWRLGVVRRHIGAALDRTPGRFRALSLCSGDGRDILGVLSMRDDASRVSATLVEVHPGIAAAARTAAAAAKLRGVGVRTADAGRPETYADAVPADLVLLVGIFGNIDDDDLHRTIAAAPALCRPGATLLWSRMRGDGDRGDAIRAGFAAGGFTELAYETRERGSRPALGAVRYDGPPRPLPTGQLFSFVR